MTEPLDEIGPVDYLIVEWGAGSAPDGKALPHLVDLVDRGLIRILDLAFVQRALDGTTVVVAIEDFDLDGDPDLAVFVGASSGILDEGDLLAAGEILEPGCAAALLVYENRWALPFAAALRGAGAQLVSRGPILIDDLVEALDELEAAGV